MILEKKEILNIFKEHNTQFQKEFGQNYLQDINSINAVTSKLAHQSKIIEIGPGIGNITTNYYKDYEKVILIEIDNKKIDILVDILKKSNNNIFPSNIEIVNKDILEIDFKSIFNGSYEVIGALPYNISKKIIHLLLTFIPTPQQCTFIIQKEVAEKYIGKPNECFLSISSYYLANIEGHEVITKDKFFPSPKVDSQIITINNYKFNSFEKLSEIIKKNNFIKLAFKQPRKKIINNLKGIKFSLKSKSLLNKRPHEINELEWNDLFDDYIINQ